MFSGIIFLDPFDRPGLYNYSINQKIPIRELNMNRDFLYTIEKGIKKSPIWEIGLTTKNIKL